MPREKKPPKEPVARRPMTPEEETWANALERCSLGYSAVAQSFVKASIPYIREHGISEKQVGLLARFVVMYKRQIPATIVASAAPIASPLESKVPDRRKDFWAARDAEKAEGNQEQLF